jgi:predicted nucleotidyltransferase
MTQDELIAAIAERLSDNRDVDGLFLSGSFGRGTADQWSDVDLVALVAPERQAEFVAAWRAALEAITPIVFWQEVPRGGILLNAVSEEWLRCDLVVVAPDGFGRRARNTVKPLIDRRGLYDSLPEALPHQQPDAGTVRYLIHEFIRMLGLMPVVLGRGEYVTMVLGVGMLRGHLETLLMQDVTEPDPGGILHQSKVLGPEAMRMLYALPYPPPEREAVIEANFAIAREFMPRARAMATRLGIDWPEAFEAATRRRLATTLGEKAGQAW